MEQIKKNEVSFPFLTKPLEVYERACGHTVVLAHKEGEMINISTWVKTGSINENDEITGISHFLEHVMFKGTKNHKAGEFDKFLESKGAIVNAATWKDYTFYYVTLPKGEKNQNLYDVIELHADMMLNPVFPESELGAPFDLKDENVKEKRERHVVIEEIGMRDDQPWSKVYNYANKAMYTSHPYKRDVIGTAEVISSVPRDTIAAYYNKYYSPNNLTTIVVGDFDKEDILNRVCKEFDFTGREQTKLPVFEIDKPKKGQQYIENYTGIHTGFLMFGYITCLAKDFKTTLALEMLSIILGEGQSSRLNQNLIEKVENPVFNLVSSVQYSFKDGNNFFIQANFTSERKEQAVEQIKSEISKLIVDGITDKEYKKAVKCMKSRFANECETVSELADIIGYYATVCDDVSMLSKYLGVINSVTKEDLQSVAKEYLDLDKVTISVLLPEDCKK